MLKKFIVDRYARLPVVREIREIRRLLAASLEQRAGLESVRLFDLELDRHPRYSDPRRLFHPYLQVSSQNGEDGVIREIFRRIGLTNRVFAELGVGNGYENNTAFLLSQGWTGVWVDGNPRFRKALEGREDIQPPVLRTATALVSKENALATLQGLNVPDEFDLLSIDIDQNTYFIWEGLRTLRPRVVVVEYNCALPPDLDWKVRYEATRVWDERSSNFGASLKALENLGRTLRYSLVGCEFVGSNAFFVRDDLIGDHFAAPFTAENHYEPPRYVLLSRRAYTGAILDRLG
ncbi:MAG: hypothetical protein JO295_03785 [Verrucomicrobia bacterium]|nr:hypothetical protein [Verrucomicrobiota bacterium]